MLLQAGPTGSLDIMQLHDASLRSNAIALYMCAQALTIYRHASQLSAVLLPHHHHVLYFCLMLGCLGIAAAGWTYRQSGHHAAA